VADLTGSPAYRRGVARAEAELAKVPPPDPDAVSVSLPLLYEGDTRDRFKLCRRCGWARPGRCTCQGPQ
jgi:hypothetical protein